MGYRGKVEEQNRARDLRRQGWTLTEICDELGICKSSASVWCRDVEIDQQELERRRRQRFLTGNEGARQRGPNKLQRRKQAEIERLQAEGLERIGGLSDRDLPIAGLALYAGEGSKADGTVSFANSDPRMITLFLVWLRRLFVVDETRLRSASPIGRYRIRRSGARSIPWAAPASPTPPPCSIVRSWEW